MRRASSAAACAALRSLVLYRARPSANLARASSNLDPWASPLLAAAVAAASSRLKSESPRAAASSARSMRASCEAGAGKRRNSPIVVNASCDLPDCVCTAARRNPYSRLSRKKGPQGLIHLDSLRPIFARLVVPTFNRQAVLPRKLRRQLESFRGLVLRPLVITQGGPGGRQRGVRHRIVRVRV